MAEENFYRMIRLPDEFFGARSDSTQISVTSTEMKKLQRIDPDTMTEKRTARGPVAWILVLPTTHELMNKFLQKKITERQMLAKTPVDKDYQAAYLCSALVLPEYRRRGIAKKLLMKAIRTIQKRHSIDTLFYWGFSPAGSALAHSAAKALHLPLRRRPT
jgi:ribosomal protein S18 acetylase RimI-like enzyme